MLSGFRLVEFIGGPLDGHRIRIPAAPEQLESTLNVRISRNLFQMMDGKPARPAAFPTSTAVYSLDRGVDRPAYKFSKAIQTYGTTISHRPSWVRRIHVALQRIIGRWTSGAARRAEPFAAAETQPEFANRRLRDELKRRVQD